MNEHNNVSNFVLILMILLIAFCLFSNLFFSDEFVENSEPFYDGSNYQNESNNTYYENPTVVEEQNDVNSVNTQVNSDNYTGYYYKQLTDSGKKVYEQIVEGCNNYKDKIKINNLSQEVVYSAEYAVSSDYPEFYWISDFTVVKLGDVVTEIQFEVPVDARENRAKIDNKVDEILADASALGSNYLKIKYFYEWIINNTDYGDVAGSQNITSVFIGNTSVCAGYSRAFLYLCKKAGIECAYVPGFTGNSELHAWNLVKINGQYYWVDTTWGDPVFSREGGNNINYNYFCVSDKEFMENHEIETKITFASSVALNTIFYFPTCVDDSLNYYLNNGSYFYTYNEEAIRNYLKSKFEAGTFTDIDLKFKTMDQYEQFMYNFITRDEPILTDIIKSVKPLYFGSIGISYTYVESAKYINLSVSLS